MSEFSFATVLSASPLLCTGRLLDNTEVDPPGKVNVSVSVRKVITKYRGVAMRVRRTSDNTEKDIGFLETDLDVPSLLRFANGFDAFVSIWYDQSGEGNDVFQPVWSLQPQIVVSGKVITDLSGNRPTLRFQGAYMTSSWSPQAIEFANASGISTVASTGITTLDTTGSEVLVTGRQTGSISTYDLGSSIVNPLYPEKKLPEGYDVFALESFQYRGNLVYCDSDNRKYKYASVDTTQDPPVTTVSDTGFSAITGPSVITAEQVIPRKNDGSLVYPSTANDEFIDIVLDINPSNDDPGASPPKMPRLYGVPWNSNFVMEINETGEIIGSETKSTAEIIGLDLGNIGQKYHVGIAHTDGIYCIPYNAQNILWIDTTTQPATVTELTPNDPTGNPYPLSGEQKFMTAQKVGNVVYCIPFDHGYVAKITLKGSNTEMQNIGSSYMPGGGKFHTSSLAGQYIIAPPWNAGSVLVVDTTNNSVDLVGSTGGYFSSRGMGRGYIDSSVLLSSNPQNGGNSAGAIASMSISDILGRVDIDSSQGNSGYFTTPSCFVRTGPDTLRAPSVELLMEDDPDPGVAEGLLRVKDIVVTDGGDCVVDCQVYLTGGFGENARARAFIDYNENDGYGPVSSVLITNSGSGYLNIDSIQITVSGGGLISGQQHAELQVDKLFPVSQGGGIDLITVKPGRGGAYRRPPTITITGGKGSPAIITPIMVSDGKVTDLNIDSAGTGYDTDGATTVTNELAANGWTTRDQFFENYVKFITNQSHGFTYPPSNPGPLIRFKTSTDPDPVSYLPNDQIDGNGNRGNAVGVGGSGIGSHPTACAYVSAFDATGGIQEVTFVSTGSGYLYAPTVVIAGPGSGASVTASFEKDGRLSMFPSLNQASGIGPGTKYTARDSGIRPSRLIRSGNGVVLSEDANPGEKATFDFLLEGECILYDVQVGEDQYPNYIHQGNRFIRRDGYSKWKACVYNPENKLVYAVPYETHRAIYIQCDPSDPRNVGRAFNLTFKSTTNYDDGPGGSKFSDVIMNPSNLQFRRAYAIPYNRRYVLVIDGTTIDWLRSETGQLKRFNGQWNAGILHDDPNVGNGIIYGIPANENSLLMIETKLDGQNKFQEYLSSTETFGNLRGQGNKFGSAAVASSNIIYFINRFATFVAELNPGTSLLRKTSLNDVIVFPSNGNVHPISPMLTFPWDPVEDQNKDPNGSDPYQPTQITFGEGVELSTGNVVFVPTYNPTDPVSYQGKILEIDPLTPDTYTKAFIDANPGHYIDPKYHKYVSRTIKVTGYNRISTDASNTDYSTLLSQYPVGTYFYFSSGTTTFMRARFDPDSDGADGEHDATFWKLDGGTDWRNDLVLVETDGDMPITLNTELTVSVYTSFASYLHQSIPVQDTPPFPSRCCVTWDVNPQEDPDPYVSWVPRMTATSTDHAIKTWRNKEPDLSKKLSGFGSRPSNQSNLRWATQVHTSGQVTCGCVPSSVTIKTTAPADLLNILPDEINPAYFTGYGTMHRFCDGVVDRHNRIVLVPGHVIRGETQYTEVHIIYPNDYGFENNTAITRGPGVKAGTGGPLFPQDGDATDNNLLFPTTIELDNSLWDNWGPPRASNSFDESVIAYGGAALSTVDQMIYCVPFNSIHGLVIDTDGYGYERLGDFSNYVDSAAIRIGIDPNVPATPNPSPPPAFIQSPKTYAQEMFRGVIEGFNSKLYGIPYGANHVCEIDPSIPDAEVRSTFLSTKMEDLLGESNYNGKWWGAVRATNGKIYCVPYNATGVLVITPGEGTDVTTLEIPVTLTNATNSTKWEKDGKNWANGVLAENGNIYCCPVNNDNVLKIIPGQNGEKDQYTLIPLFAGEAKFWAGVYSAYDKFVYFFPGYQGGGTMLRLDTVSESYERVGDAYRTDDDRWPGKWTSRPITLPSGATYVLPGRGVVDALTFQASQTTLFETDKQNSAYTTGQPIPYDFILKPYIVTYSGNDESYALFHNIGTYGLYDVNRTAKNQAIRNKIPLIKGPLLENGVTGMINGDFVSLFRATLHIIQLFQGGVAGVRSPIQQADLALMAVEPNLVSFIGDSDITVNNIFRTVFRQGVTGIFSTLASLSNIVLSYIKGSAVVKTVGYGVTGNVDGAFSTGQVSGYQDLQLTCPKVSRVTTTSASSSVEPVDNAFDQDVSSFWQSDATYDSSSGLNDGSKQWISIQFDTAVRIGSFALVSPRATPNTMPSKYTLYGSDDGSTWTPVQEYSGIERTEYIQFERREFVLTTCGYYFHYKLEVDSVFPGGESVEISSWVIQGRYKQVTGDEPAYRSMFSGHISEIVALTRTDQQNSNYGSDQNFYYNYSSSPYISDSNSTKQ